MACYEKVICPKCGSEHIVKSGKTKLGVQRYLCRNQDCPKKTFLQTYQYNAYETGIKEQIIDMAINGSGIRDTARVLKIDKHTVISTLKKKKKVLSISIPILRLENQKPL